MKQDRLPRMIELFVRLWYKVYGIHKERNETEGQIGMASSREYLDYVLEQLAPLDGISCRAMMGEFILYCRGKIIGGIYDDRLLVKPTASARRLMPGAPRELPYEGAKEMLLVEDVDDREFLCELVDSVADELPAPGKKRRAAADQG